MNDIISAINGYLWGWPMIILLVGTHLYLTIRLRCPQRYLLKAIRLSVARDRGSSGDVSQFSALATGLAATIGTGNIIGVATAVTLGGPGAVLWCWLTGVLGIATKYGEALLAVKYRVGTPDGKMLGGPMYALERGMGCRWLGVAFAVFTFLASFGIGGMVQSNAIATVMADSFGCAPALTGLVCALLVGSVTLFGVRGVGRVCGLLVPFMAAFYVVGCLALLVVHADYVWPALCTICREAFSLRAAGGGAAGAGLIVAMRFGIARGLFSNEAGLGSAPIVAAAARTRNPVRQALVSSTSVFWDTVVVCALTGVVLVATLLAGGGDGGSEASSALLTQRAFEALPVVVAGHPMGGVFLSVAIFTFALSTILGWSYYGEKALEYLCGRWWREARYVYRVLITGCTFVGACWTLDAVWDFADMANALMAIPNLVCLLALSGTLVSETRHYLWEGHLDDEADAGPDSGRC